MEGASACAPARETADLRANIVFPQSAKSGVIEVRMPKTDEAMKNVITCHDRSCTCVTNVLSRKEFPS